MSIKEYDTKRIKIADLVFDDSNPNRMSAEQEQALKKAFHRFGYLVPIIVNEQMKIGDGEHRALVYKEMGIESIPAYVVPEINDDIERRLLRQTMNKLRGEHDVQLDATEIELIFRDNKLDDLTALLAKDRSELEYLLTKHKGIEFQHEDNFDLNKTLEELVPVTQLGDMWQLGQHRIICADCTNQRSIRKLLEDKTTDLIVTSPPYDDIRSYENNFNVDELGQIFLDIVKEGGVIVWVVGDQTTDGDESGSSFRQILSFKDMGFKLHDTMIYEKMGFARPSNNRYHQIFEYMFILVKGKIKKFNPIKDRDNVTVGRIHKANQKTRNYNGELKAIGHMPIINDFGMRGNIWAYAIGGLVSAESLIAHKHPAIFPLKLVNDHIKSWSTEGDTVMDCFLGSGTTLIACEQTNRICYGVEIDPHYVDVCVKRWEAFTGKKAELVRLTAKEEIAQ